MKLRNLIQQFHMTFCTDFKTHHYKLNLQYRNVTYELDHYDYCCCYHYHYHHYYAAIATLAMTTIATTIMAISITTTTNITTTNTTNIM